MLEACALFLISLAGGLLPVMMRWSHRQLHTALALSTGIFLGAVFLHLLPSLSQFQEPLDHSAELSTSHIEEQQPAHEHQADDAEHAEHTEHVAQAPGSHAHGDSDIWLFVLIGVLGVYLVEALVLRTHDHDEAHRHQAVGYASLFGLSVHALSAGMALGISSEEATLATPMLVAMLSHKGFESFSLASVFQLAERKRRRVVLMVIAFSLITPLGMFLGGGLTHLLGDYGLGILQALAAGTFLFVCLSELLPEVFHHREDTIKRLALIAIGIVLMYIFGRYGE